MSTLIKTAWSAIVLVVLTHWTSIDSNAAEPPEVHRGKYVELTGTYELLVAETFDGRPPVYRHSLNLGSDFVSLERVTPPDNLQTGDTVVVSGTRTGHTLRVDSLVRLDVDRRLSRSTLAGARSVAIIYLNFSDKDLEAGKIEEVPKAMYSNLYYPINLDGDSLPASPAHVKASLELSSYNQVTLDADANGDGEIDQYGPYTLSLPSTSCGLEQAWANAGDLYAELQGADMSLYQHKIYIVPLHQCNWNGLGLINCGDNCRAWSRTDWQQTLSHELGHNFGLNHAAKDVDGDGQIETLELVADRGVMMASGNSGLNGHLMHAPNRDKLGWFDAVPGALVDIDSTGTYTIADLQDMQGDYSQALRLTLSALTGTRTLYLAYRQGDLNQYGLVNTFFSPDPLIADTLRVHECIDVNCARTTALATLEAGDVYLDEASVDEEFPLLIQAQVTTGDNAIVNVYLGDTDTDGIPDYEDNCYLIANADQTDSDCDGIGNRCDGDFNNDGNVNVIDLGILRSLFFTDTALADLNSDGAVNSIDLGIFNTLFFETPGPAGPLSACSL